MAGYKQTRTFFCGGGMDMFWNCTLQFPLKDLKNRKQLTKSSQGGGGGVGGGFSFKIFS